MIYTCGIMSVISEGHFAMGEVDMLFADLFTANHALIFLLQCNHVILTKKSVLPSYVKHT